MLQTYTEKYTRFPGSYMGQLIECRKSSRKKRIGEP